MVCPKCDGPMTERLHGGVPRARCEQCGGVFLDRADLADLVEAENDWHAASGPQTAPLPRITPGMPAPPVPEPAPRARAYIEELFG